MLIFLSLAPYVFLTCGASLLPIVNADEEAKSWGNIDAFDRVKRVNKGIHSWYLGSRSRKD